jgi:hypothetical protein
MIKKMDAIEDPFGNFLYGDTIENQESSNIGRGLLRKIHRTADRRGGGAAMDISVSNNNRIIIK